MKIIGEIIFEYDNENNSKLIFDSLEIDNKNFLKSEKNKNNITYQIKSDKLGSFLATTDDLIASEIVAEKIIQLK